MRASVKLLIGLLAGNLALAAGPVSAAPQCNLAFLFQSGGDFSLPVANNAKNKTEQFLQQAKRAMQEKRFDEAEYNIRKAEEAAAAIPANEQTLLYTPQQARRDLQLLQTPRTTGAAVAEVPATAPQPTALGLLSNESQSQAAGQSAVLLQDARRAMAVGDLQKATKLVQQAKSLGLKYADGADSPQLIESMIAGHQEASRLQRAGDPKARRAIADHLMHQAEGMMQYKDYELARSLVNQAAKLPVEYGPNEKSPAKLLAILDSQRSVATIRPQGSTSSSKKQEALRLMAEGRLALNKGDLAAAERFSQAASALKVADSEFGEEEPRPWDLELAVRSAINKRGTGVAQAEFQETADNSRSVVQAGYEPDKDGSRVVPVTNTVDNAQDADDQLLEEIDSQQQILFQQFSNEIFKSRAAVESMTANKDARGGLNHLKGLRDRISAAQLNPVKKKQLLTIVDREINEQQHYIELNIADIQNEEINAERKDDVENRRNHKLEVDSQIQRLVEDFNKLVNEGRYAEAEMVARQAYELAPQLEVVQALNWKAKFIRRYANQMAMRDQAEGAFQTTMDDVENSRIGLVNDAQPLKFPAAEDWEGITKSRLQSMEGALGQSVEDIRLRNLLRTQKVDVRFDNLPLSEVRAILSQQAGINIYLDERAIAAQGVTRDMPITVNLPEPISLHSALTLILESHNLTYMVKDEVVQITSKERRDNNLVKKSYYVGDMVIPIPNFVPSNNLGLSAAIGQSLQQAAYAANSLNGNRRGMDAQPTPDMLSSNAPQSTAVAALGQAMPGVGAMPGMGGPVTGGNPMAAMGGGQGGFGAGGMGGGVVADFDPLMELIRTTISPESWDEMGGTGTMSEFRTNLSLVISNTQEVHEQIQSLLDQLRRLQDLQITIEVRFITLTDDFFERIGIDFDFNIEDHANVARGQALPDRAGKTQIIGNNAFGPTGDLDLQFRQDSFTSAVPQFGGFDVNTAANFGFAILSDIEVFFLIQASKGDQRSNILQAPKVTLFNGQNAQVADQTLRPFVTSIIPVVGDFAAAHQPVITVLSEGTSLSVNAVASADRRFVRLTLVPFFSQITDVDEFTFEGKRTTNTGTSVIDPTNPAGGFFNDDKEETVEGTTVQLPVFAITTVSTTVNVPDGGTVLLGGIKRLQEGRNERGVPILSNIPYVNRLFKNVGIGRTSQSLMMMVTPRIIIQEEEEQNQVPGIGR